MNIVKLQQQLQSVGDQDLIGYMQNPNPQVPAYLVLSELERRKQMRSQYSAGKPEQPPVAEQVVAEAGQGVAGLSAPNVGTEQGFDAGGIVAFAQGGYWEDGRYISPEEADAMYARAIDESMLGDFARGVKRGASGIARLPKKLGEGLFGYRLVKDPITGEMVRADNLRDFNKRDTTGEVRIDSRAFDTPQLKVPPKTDNNVAQPRAFNVSETKETPVANTEKAPGMDKVQGSTMRNGAGRSAPTQVGGIADIVKFNPIADPREAIMQGAPQVPGAEDEMARYNRMIGSDTNRAEQKAYLERMQNEAIREKQVAPWMALANAGLSIAAGKSQNAITNIAEGAKAGVADLQAAKDRARAGEERMFNLRNQIAQAERAEQVAAAKFGIDSVQAQQARADKFALQAQQASLEVAKANAAGQFDAARTNADITEKRADRASRERMNQQDNAAAMERAKYQGKSQDRYVVAQNIQSLTAVLRDNAARIKQLETETSTPAARVMEGYQEKVDELKQLKASSAAINQRLLEMSSGNSSAGEWGTLKTIPAKS